MAVRPVLVAGLGRLLVGSIHRDAVGMDVRKSGIASPRFCNCYERHISFRGLLAKPGGGREEIKKPITPGSSDGFHSGNRNLIR